MQAIKNKETSFVWLKSFEIILRQQSSQAPFCTINVTTEYFTRNMKGADSSETLVLNLWNSIFSQFRKQLLYLSNEGTVWCQSSQKRRPCTESEVMELKKLRKFLGHYSW